MTPYAWNVERSFEADRQEGRKMAMREWLEGERTPLRERDRQHWDWLDGCVRSGYSSVWADLFALFSQTFCVAHHNVEPCAYCSRANRAPISDDEEVTAEAIREAEMAW